MIWNINVMKIKGTDIEIPDSLIVDGDLNLRDTGATELPKGLKVDGNLDLYGTEITSLPTDLVVGGYLYLRGTNVTSLPPGLVVGGYLNLGGSNVVSLTECMVVGRLYAGSCQLIASELVQLEWIVKNKDMLRVFKEPTEKAKRLHQMLWEV